MTNKDNFEIVSKELNPFFKQNGFNGSKIFWYRKVENFYQVIELQKSNWSGYYINIGLIIDLKNDKIKKTPSYKWHYSTRFDQIVGWNNQDHNSHFGLDFDSENELIQKTYLIEEKFKELVFPLLDKISNSEYFRKIKNFTVLETFWIKQNIKEDEIKSFFNIA
ncbi:DUF4304 domain-containing protein [Haliscomenobacter sp.]|uniref:DUF4304 domain-containing protein n=1 Tax=Haliscomenobacter sp. TaxID=2717303 RepID=UPI0035948132